MFKACDAPIHAQMFNSSEQAKAFVLELCQTCQGTGHKERRCGQCWKFKPIGDFMGAKRKFINRCQDCQKKYNGWDKKPLELRMAATNPRKNIPNDGPLRVSFVLSSGNRKTGPIPVSMTSARTCPTSCPLYGNGCYAEQHMMSMHWRRLGKGGGMSWDKFVKAVALLPDGQLWRHNEAGDLPGDDELIDRNLLQALVNANRGKRGFTYTHKPVVAGGKNHQLIQGAIYDGFTINISTDSLQEADEKAELGLPVTVVLDHNSHHKGIRTPAGRHVVVCPAQRREDVTCESCKLCAVAGRRSIVGFLAHGDRRKQITERNHQLPMFKE